MMQWFSFSNILYTLVCTEFHSNWTVWLMFMLNGLELKLVQNYAFNFATTTILESPFYMNILMHEIVYVFLVGVKQ